jgi:hypothetical protein
LSGKAVNPVRKIKVMVKPSKPAVRMHGDGAGHLSWLFPTKLTLRGSQQRANK